MITNYIHWNIDPEIINIFGVSIRYYGLLFTGGLILCFFILKGIFSNENIPLTHLEKLSTYGIIGIFVGMRLGHCFFYEPSYYFSHPLEIILPIQPTADGGYKFSGFQGLASHGGTLGLIIALVIYAKKTKESIIKTVDLIAVVAPLGACFIRLANFMNSEIIGYPTTVPWAFVFERVDNLPRHPAQLYEAISYLLILGLMFYLYKTKRETLQNGFFFGLVITLIFIARFLIEFVKERQVSFEDKMQFDMGQLLSIPFIIVGLSFIIIGLVKTRNNTQPPTQVHLP
ncbi:prolipoprotein diacylglyceryl transferase [Solitalea longa]|uniref:Phosphatidylglycerol--prolipoprotein diacylglyceryl transferase n=1 Tax=Solitalea longa TaxID=2079460 RepID=A0A2S4ZZY6_9SPHI|nr:prolipoprotein diacylglyceryl transferase [Solitalea longa]POY35876.1 prolipoprotein diacylglyceryl transferase [Solitalea longa]